MQIRTDLKKLSFKLQFMVYFIMCINVAISEKLKVKKIGKDVRDMTDADLEMLFDQWEQDDDPLEPDELPEHLRPQPNIDLSQVDFSNPDNILKVSKKGKSTMMFIDVDSKFTESEADNILRIWQSSLQNNHIIAERFPIEQKRAIFMFRDGSQAVDAKNFLIQQPECSYITLEGQSYVGKYANNEVRQKLGKLEPNAKVETVKKDQKIDL